MTATAPERRDAGWRFWIDRGGTFTDIVATAPDGSRRTLKLLSDDPSRYADAAIAGIRACLRLGAGEPIPDGAIEAVKMGTTVATNALLERKGARVLLLIDRGLGDLLRIGTQARPNLFTFDIRLPSMLYERVVEIGGRIGADGTIVETLDEQTAQEALRTARLTGIESVAIARMHAWRYPAHEERLAALAVAEGFTQISTSHATSPVLRLVSRGDTTVADAYLSPILRRYIDHVAAGMPNAPLYFMQSLGGLTAADQFTGKDAILSGPAGGIVGAARTATMAGFDRIIGFDMGGTSTDVSIYDRGYERTLETEIAGVRLRVPMLAINTVAAGGGSVLGFDGARLRVGPDSAGADPGPACYRRGGPLTVTDANVLLGKLAPAQFPAIFGPDHDQTLDAAIVRERFAERAREIALATSTDQTPERVAAGYIAIAVARMAQAIRQITIQKGRDPADFALACFGGAGGQHACLVAEALGMRTILIHPLAGVLSAYGMGLADQIVLREQAVECEVDPAAIAALEAVADQLGAACVAALAAQGAVPDSIMTRRRAHLRYAGTDTPITVDLADAASMREAFEAAHRRLFGFVMTDRQLIAESIVVEAMAPGETIIEPVLAPREAGAPVPLDRLRFYAADTWQDAPVFDRDALCAGDVIMGPAMLREANATTIIEPGWSGTITLRNHLVMTHHAGRSAELGEVGTGEAATRVDPVRLELFNNLFMAIAEQSGAVLRNTASSVNIKERLDFSCALFDPTGGLIANAPHVPVHLGAMSESVRIVLARRGATLRQGDAVALNNPYNGGTHLPDITVITPMFDLAGTTLRGFVASRGHHADVGGLTPGSMPPFATKLEEEGVVIDDFLLVTAGEFREDDIRAVLGGARYPARNPDECVADLKAQLAANAAGIAAFEAAVAQYGFATVAAYTGHVMDNAEASVRRAIGTLRDGAYDYRMDDGTSLAVRITVDQAAKTAVIDFTGTSGQHRGNFNAPPAVTRAAVLYVFRCLVNDDIPLNEGCLRPLTLVIPPGSFLNPHPGAAVVAGNTEVSQAVTAALLGALGVCASAQATMNNLLFGNQRYQYYETICGGAGAGPGFDGCDAVQTHMTNTRMTDPEVLELRYPARVEMFAIRRGSGGAGHYRGGDGAIRRLRFLEPMIVTVLASRRSVAPFGIEGGGDGATGRQWVERADGSVEPIGGCDQAKLRTGDAIVIETPGGGGYGEVKP
ncbi:hydantoinase B/oxoprolinase family protein [Acidiphilium sp. PA]|uniref:hydantoinase B/oxoprolinase family protein n=1 Tax=Acidiphilium sp. PA TaxID=2871705 RepID=UPI0022443168|nr:hydantoinase B/oxoprolinase family protein [Acidiphilium sp. PA]MCW8308922.1 hydantoinase B/oxoprolinase family protein [Acidiphilium sp. PA]